MHIWKPCDKKWRHNDVITKNNGKPIKLYVIRKVFTRAVQNCKLYQIWTILSKVMDI